MGMLLPKPTRVRLSPQDYKRQRQLLAERSGWRCAKCGKITGLDRDHIKKRSQLGGDGSDNAQMLCRKCHDRKDNQVG